MKKVFFLLLAAMMTIAMVSCEKDNEETNNQNNTNNGGNNGGAIENTDNMATVGTITSNLSSDLDFDDFGTANISARSMPGNRRAHFGAGIAWESLNKTLDLANPQDNEEYWFRYEVENDDDMIMFTQSNYSGEVNSDLGHEESTHNPVFTRGTLTTTRTAEGYTLVINGTLKDGTSVLISLKMDFTGEIVPLTRNSMILDGVKYAITSQANQNTGTGVVSWSCTGDNISASGNIYPYSDNLHAYLDQNPTGDGYRFSFNITAPGLQIEYEWNNDQLIGTLNGTPFTSTPFTDGYAETFAYSNDMSFILIGTLSNGKEIKLYVDSNY